MKRIFTGWILIMLMAVFTVTANSSLRYCLCDKAVFLGECDCVCVRTNLCPAACPANPAPSECNCCGHCSENSNSAPPEDHLSIKCSCTINLSIPLNDFVINADTFQTENISKPHTPIIEAQQDFTVPTEILARCAYATRGSPPSLTRTDVPIYIRDSVYRL
jgi:hypothetical protein